MYFANLLSNISSTNEQYIAYFLYLAARDSSQSGIKCVYGVNKETDFICILCDKSVMMSALRSRSTLQVRILFIDISLHIA